MKEITKALAPYMEEVATFAMSIPDMQPSDDPISVPVGASVNSEMAFGEDHANKQESIFKLIDGLFRGHIMPESLGLHVFLHVGRDGARGLYSRNNRRTIALHCFQAMRRDHAVRVPSRVFLDNDPRPCPTDNRSLKQWFNEGYDGAGSFEGCNGLGRSIFPGPGSSNHRGYERFKPVACARRILKRASERVQSDQHTQTVNAMRLVLASTNSRALQGDEETLTLSSNVGDHDQPARVQQPRGRGNVKGDGKGWKGRGNMKSAGQCR